MSKKAYIIGAGFTKAWNPKHAPVMDDFFKIATENGVLNKYDDDKKLTEFINGYFGDINTANLESIATYLKTELFPEGAYFKAFQEFLYHRLLLVIQEVLENIHKNPANEEINQLYSEFAKNIKSENSNIVTFNYDLLIDYLLEKNANWVASSGYGIYFDVFDNIEEPDYEDKIRHRLYGSKITLLKLHGSLNWCTPLIPEPNSNPKIYCTSHFVESIDNFEQPGIFQFASGTTNYLFPFIIPPLLDKSILGHQQFLQSIWYCARDILSKSDDIDIIGYSFPSSDFATESLIRKSNFNHYIQTGTGKRRKVRCINKYINDDYRNRIKKMFNRADVEFIEMDFIEYLRNFNNYNNQ